jgi:Carboxypeptidase regulatory-like domain/TonB dependent receptor/TonB-dependent Receptor Plug Domain
MTPLSKRSFYSWLLLAALSVSLARLAGAQTSLATGRLEGTVYDTTGAAVPAAAATVRNEATGVTFRQTSDDGGRFTFLNLDPGSYELTIEKKGFSIAKLQGLTVTVGTTTSVRPQLRVGSFEETVTVTAETPLVDTSQSALSAVVNQRAITTLPLNGRNFTDFVLLTPGVTTDGDFGMISFNGLAGNYNSYTVDGSNDNNAFFAQQIGRTSIPFQFSEDIIQEFQVISNGFNAEFGQAGGGVVNTVTKSGANQLHGDGYYYILDSALDANDKINESLGIPKPKNRRQQFGTTLSGPIVHNKLFWIANYEGQRRNEPLTVDENPLGLDQLPANFLQQNPAVATLVQGAAGSHPRTFNQDTAFFKVSGLIGTRNTFDVSYNYQRFTSPHGYFNTPTSTGDGLSLTDGATSHFFQFTFRTLLNPTTTNEFRFHVGNDLHFDLPDVAPTFPAVVIQNPDSGVVMGGNRFQLSTTDRRYEFADNITKIVGRHSFKAGVDININRDRDYFVYGPHGSYVFASLADVAATPANFEYYLQSFGQSTARITSPTYSFFAQDQFHATPRLTLNYGLRYDLQVLPKPPVCNPAFTLTCQIHYSKNDVAPRLGVAYAINDKTVVRSAFGLFYAMEDLLDVSQAFSSNGIARQFLFVPGPAFGNTSPLVSYPNSLTSFPSGAGGTPSLVVFAPNFRSPYVEQANFSIERELGAKTALSLGYVFTHGVRLLGNSNGVTRQANGNFGLDINLVPPQLQPSYGGSFTTDSITLPNGKTYVVPDYEAIDGLLNQNFSSINMVDNSGSSLYHALQLSLRHQSKQFQGGVSYSFSKNIDAGTGYYNQFAIAQQRGLSQLDQTHRLVLTGAYSPIQRYLSGFTLSTVATFASGRPFEPELDVTNVNFQMVPGEGFNSFRGPGVNDVDLSLARAIRVSERVSLKLQAEAFNIVNHPNFQQSPVNQVQFLTTEIGSSNVYTAVPNPSFGTPLAVAPRYGARSLQFSVRLGF